MSKEEMIQEIEGLYPIDCQYEDTCTIGKVLLNKAMHEADWSWRDLPKPVLVKYMELCREEEESGELTSELRKQGKLVE